MSFPDPIVITHYLRTPFGRLKGGLSSLTAPQLAAHVLSHMPLKKTALDATCTLGCVLSAHLGQAPARQCLLNGGWSSAIPTALVNKVCGSGCYAQEIAWKDLFMGRATFALAGGMESMSNAPLLTSHQDLTQIQDSLFIDGLTDAFTHELMGALAEKTAEKLSISRHQQEDFALQSAHNAIAGYEEGFFQGELVPHLPITQDESLSRIHFQKFRSLPPVFGGTITAATASSLADGAAFTLSCRLSVAQRYDLTPLAVIREISTFSGAPEDFIEAPAFAIQSLLQRLDWSLNDVDVFEINEAFALSPLAVMAYLPIPRDKINMYGGSCALGHPLGATGTRLIGTLARIMNHRGLARGVAALCIGGGEGMAVALEHPSLFS